MFNRFNSCMHWRIRYGHMVPVHRASLRTRQSGHEMNHRQMVTGQSYS